MNERKKPVTWQDITDFVKNPRTLQAELVTKSVYATLDAPMNYRKEAEVAALKKVVTETLKMIEQNRHERQKDRKTVLFPVELGGKSFSIGEVHDALRYFEDRRVTKKVKYILALGIKYGLVDIHGVSEAISVPQEELVAWIIHIENNEQHKNAAGYFDDSISPLSLELLRKVPNAPRYIDMENGGKIDFVSRDYFDGQHRIRLTPVEIRFIFTLSLLPNAFISFQTLLTFMYRDKIRKPNLQNVKTILKDIRKKIPTLTIESKQGLGYMLKI